MHAVHIHVNISMCVSLCVDGRGWEFTVTPFAVIMRIVCENVSRSHLPYVEWHKTEETVDALDNFVSTTKLRCPMNTAIHLNLRFRLSCSRYTEYQLCLRPFQRIIRNCISWSTCFSNVYSSCPCTRDWPRHEECFDPCWIWESRFAGNVSAVSRQGRWFCRVIRIGSSVS